MVLSREERQQSLNSTRASSHVPSSWAPLPWDDAVHAMPGTVVGPHAAVLLFYMPGPAQYGSWPWIQSAFKKYITGDTVAAGTLPAAHNFSLADFLGFVHASSVGGSGPPVAHAGPRAHLAEAANLQARECLSLPVQPRPAFFLFSARCKILLSALPWTQ